MKASITSRLILYLTVSAGTLVAFALLVDYRLSRTEILERLRVESQKTVVDVVRDLEGLLAGVEGNTRFLGSILSQQHSDEQSISRLLQETVAQHADIFGSTVALAPAQSARPRGFAPYFYQQGDAIAYSDLTLGAEPYWERSWFTDAARSGQPRWIEPYFDVGGAEVYMTTYSVPVFEGESHRELVAVVTADITLDELHRYINRLERGDHGFGFLVSAGGLVLSSRGTSAEMVPYQQFLASEEQRGFWQQLLTEVEPGQDNSRITDCELVEGNCIIRMTRLRHSGWIVGAVYSEHEVLADLRAYELKIFALGLACLVAMIIVVNLVTRRITRPLTALAASADQLGAGQLDASLPEVPGKDEVARLVQSFAHMKDELRQHIADLEQATASRSRLEGELSAAREIQMAMLPQSGKACESHPDFELWASVEPARTVGGDLFTFGLEGRRLYMAVGDVSDKGVPAALFMARAISHLRHPGKHSPGQTLAELNNALAQNNGNCMFVTLLLAVLDLDSLELTWASAGHTPPLWLHKGCPATLLQHSGPATGLAENQQFPDNLLPLARGDRLLMYTDGIDEAFNPAGEMFGNERLAQWLAGSVSQSPEQAGEDLLATLSGFAEVIAQSDDITALLLDIPGHGNARQHQRLFHLTPDVTDASLSWLGALLGSDIPAGVRNELLLVLEEVVTNIFKYSQLGEADQISVSLQATDSELILCVRDQGIAFNPLEDAHRAELGADIAHAEIGGLGVHLIEQLTDWQRYRREGSDNCLELGRNLGES
ncbi:SpoIIE family protein phosphatase [Parahaliea maris]|nr:SpoIIE family protein phosphatase [Parahaliea maris]